MWNGGDRVRIESVLYKPFFSWIDLKLIVLSFYIFSLYDEAVFGRSYPNNCSVVLYQTYKTIDLKHILSETQMIKYRWSWKGGDNSLEWTTDSSMWFPWWKGDESTRQRTSMALRYKGFISVNCHKAIAWKEPTSAILLNISSCHYHLPFPYTLCFIWFRFCNMASKGS